MQKRKNQTRPFPLTGEDERREDPLRLVVVGDRGGRAAAEDGDPRVAQLLGQPEGGVRNQGHRDGGQSGGEGREPGRGVDQKLRRRNLRPDRRAR